MTRPRIAAIASAIIASTVAFLVVSRWGLAGTVAGAAVIPAVYSLVSHFSAEGLERACRWLRRRAHRREAAKGEPTPLDEAVGNAPLLPVGNDPGTEREPRRRTAVWPLAVVAVLALAVSAYSLSVAGGEQEPLIQQRVVEKTVVVTVQGESQAATAETDAPAGGSGSTTTTSTATTGQDQTTVSTSEDTSSTTATTTLPDEEQPPSTTTTGEQPPTTVDAP